MGNNSLTLLRNIKLNELNLFFEKRGNSHRLSDRELREYGLSRSAIAGWTTLIEVNQESVAIDIVIDNRFPFTRPILFLKGKSFFRIYPHVDENNLLCVIPPHSTSTQDRISVLIQDLLRKAEELLKESFEGKNRSDFITEFHNYWGDQNLRSFFWTLVQPGPPTRKITYFNGNSFILLAENGNIGEKWLRNRYPKSDSSVLQFDPTLFIWLEKPLYPEEFPKTNKAFSDLLAVNSPKEYDMLVEVIPKSKPRLPVVFGFSTENGPALGGIWINEPQKSSGQYGSQKRSTKLDGFRPQSVPQNVLALRYLTSMKITPEKVQRVDSEWVHTRGGTNYSNQLAKSKVAILGCGSLGADIAVSLAKAGVGRFLLIDIDVLTWDNVGRHLLGGDYVGTKKNDALKEYLLKQLPHLEISAPKGRWEDVYQNCKKEIESSNVILSTTGDWPSDSALNMETRSSLNFPTVIFGWTEPFGCAGHGLIVSDVGGCLACGMDENGNFAYKACDFPEGSITLNRAPACGTYYQPYGVIEVAPIKMMLAELVIDFLLQKVTRSELRTWIGSSGHLELYGAKWNDEWRRTFGDPLIGRKFCTVSWSKKQNCSLCGQ